MLSTAIEIAREAGLFLRRQFTGIRQINQSTHHDIKLQIDVDTQQMIEKRILLAFPNHAILGEEESHGDLQGEYRWVVDPLDGTVNYTYGLPHFCVSIALQKRGGKTHPALKGYTPILGVIFDPMRDELFHAETGKGAFLNNQPIRASHRSRLEDSILSVGFSKTAETIEEGLANHEKLVRRARKIRAMGSAALDIAYVASGRMEAYFETRISLWDIAAGLVILDEAGGTTQLHPLDDSGQLFSALATNGKLDLAPIVGWKS